MLTSLLHADEYEYRKEMMEQAEYEYFRQHHPILSAMADKWRILKHKIRHQINTHFICPILGHDMQSCTFFTEDQGVERWWCNRCNAHGTNFLY